LSAKDKVAEKIRQALLGFDAEATIMQVEEALKASLGPGEIIDILSEALRTIGDKFSRHEVFLPELIVAGDAMKAAMKILTPLMGKGETRAALGGVVSGTVQGDIHDIGKSIVGALLQASGFEVVDLGVDVPTELFVENVAELKPEIVGMSALLTTTMGEMRRVIGKLRETGLRDKVKIIVGGAPTSEKFAGEIGADAWGADANDACLKIKKLLGIEG